MKRQTRKTSAARLIALIAAAIMCLSVIGAFVGCGTTDTGGGVTPPVYTPPAPTPKVHSVSLTYNGEDIDGVLSVDISLGSIQVGADVDKDDGAEGTLSFDSSDKSVATIDGEGGVTLLSAGETVLSAEYGSEECSIVLSVGKGTIGRYTVTVNGGTSSATSAAEGDIITLTPVIPQRMQFTDWLFDDSGVPVTWVSGNMFKMPAGNVTVSAEFTDMLYTLRLVGAKVTGDGNETVQQGTVVGYDGDQSAQTAITEYKYAYDTQLTITAVNPSSGSMFVGWDENVVNNRIDGEMTMSGFAMPDEVTTIWANYSPIRLKKLLTADGIQSWTTETIDGESADPVFEGFSGYTVTIPAGTPGTTGYNEDIRGSDLNTVSNPSQAIRGIFRNRGDKDVTIEIYASFLTNLATSGWVTIPAGQTVTKTFVALLGFQNNPWWGFSVRENVDSSGGDVPLDMVFGCADAYPKGDKTLSVPAGTERVSLDNYKSHSGTFSARVDNANSWTLVASYQHGDGMTLPAIMSARLNNLPAYDPDDPYVTLYIKMQNQAASDHSYDYTFAFGKDENPLDENYELKPGNASVDFTVSNHGETKLFALRVPRSEADANFYFSIIKLEYDTDDNSQPVSAQPYYACNFSVVLTYNNGIGFTGEAIGPEEVTE